MGRERGINAYLVVLDGLWGRGWLSRHDSGRGHGHIQYPGLRRGPPSLCRVIAPHSEHFHRVFIRGGEDEFQGVEAVRGGVVRAF